MDTQDPIIKSMQDNRSDMAMGAGPTPPRQPSGQASPPIGNGPEAAKFTPSAVERPSTTMKASAPPPSIPPSPTPPPAAPKVPPPVAKRPPEPMLASKPLHKDIEPPKLPRSEGSDLAPKVNLVLLILLILLTGIGLFAVYTKLGGFDSEATETAEDTKAAVDDMNAKLDITIQRIQEQESAEGELRQSLFNAGSSLQKCADTLVTEGDKLVLDGQALKGEGEAAGDQSKIDRGQNEIDRGNAMQAQGKSFMDEGKQYQTDSGMEHSDK